jgi:hypothetical protein
MGIVSNFGMHDDIAYSSARAYFCALRSMDLHNNIEEASAITHLYNNESKRAFIKDEFNSLFSVEKAPELIMPHNNFLSEAQKLKFII